MFVNEAFACEDAGWDSAGLQWQEGVKEHEFGRTAALIVASFAAVL